MNKWLLRLSQAMGLLLVLVTLTSALWPAPAAEKEPRTALALRQIGHNYLSLTGDATSRIPAVEEREDGSLLLRLERNIAYDSLNQVARSVLAEYGIGSDYTLTLEDCGSGEIFLGSLWPGVLPNDFFGDQDAACAGRDQETRCANIGLAFATKQKAGTPLFTWLLGGLGVLLFFAGRFGPTATVLSEVPQAEPIATNEPNQLRLSKDCTFNATAHLLTIGTTEHELTYREAKLFDFFANRPNEILARADINEAVWGEEGIITGRSLDVFVSRLRKKIAETEGLEIKTVHGVGYRLLVA